MTDREESMSGDTVGESAYNAIRRDIVFGRLSPGQKLKLETLRSGYGVSVSTLREILSRLYSEGFVVAEGQRGFEVEPVSAEGFREVAGMRLLLECHALQAAIEQGDLEWEGRVVAAHHKLSTLEARMAEGDRTAAEAWKRYDREFHTALVSACGSEFLLETHGSVYDKYLRYQMVGDIYRGEVAAQEHRDLMRCALRRDFAGAREILARHVQDCVETALAKGELSWLQPPGRLHARTPRSQKDARLLRPRGRRAGRRAVKRKAGRG